MRGMVTACVMMLGVTAGGVNADTVNVRIDPAMQATVGKQVSGRLLLFYITQKGREFDRRLPMDAPNFEHPQPMAGADVREAAVDSVMVIDGKCKAFPSSIDDLDGEVRVQAFLDMDQKERSFEEGVGNLFSDVLTVTVKKGVEDQYELVLSRAIPEMKRRTDNPHVKWVSMKSELLSAFCGHDVSMKAGVALPKHYGEKDWPRKQWPAMYVIPGFGGREESAWTYGEWADSKGIEDIAPIAVYVVLDPECELGHHGFADSDNNGPRGEALVREFIPWLEKQFDLVPNADARIVTGHSSGGWSSLWLQLNYPDVFGATWSSAPDPVNFHFFQMTDLYEDGNLFRSPGMQDDTPSYRWYVDATYVPKVLMTVRQETAMEDVLDPHGRSGQQWDTWEAMFSQKDSSTGMPRPMFDSATGTIDAETVAHWQKYDMYKKVDEHWDTLGPVLTQRVRLVVGSVDSYYLNRAVESLKKLVEQKTGKTEEPTPEGQKKKHVDGSKSGYIDIYGGDDHESIVTNTTIRWNKEMRDYLMQHGYQDEGPEYIDDDDNVQMHPVKPE